MENFAIAILIIMGVIAIPILIFAVDFFVKATIDIIDEVRSWF